jgi:hypothetical protein
MGVAPAAWRPAAIAQHIADGYVTRDAARRDCGEEPRHVTDGPRDGPIDSMLTNKVAAFAQRARQGVDIQPVG